MSTVRDDFLGVQADAIQKLKQKTKYIIIIKKKKKNQFRNRKLMLCVALVGFNQGCQMGGFGVGIIGLSI